VQLQWVGHATALVDVAGRRVLTDLFDEMEQLTDIDVAMLPIWGWGSTLGTGHLDPTRAATATGRIRPGIVVPIHWGTYAPEDGRRLPRWSDDPMIRPSNSSRPLPTPGCRSSCTCSIRASR